MDLQWQMLRGIVRESLRNFSDFDLDLLDFRANERASAHKIAEYLRDHLEYAIQQPRDQKPLLAVDCEYNRFGMGGTPKRLPWYHEVPLEEGGAYYTPNPDIAIHERGNQNSNILIIEIKTHFNDFAASVLLDRMKLVGYLGEPTRYRFGLFLKLDIDYDKEMLIPGEAKLLDREKLSNTSHPKRDVLWNSGRALLVDEYPNRKKASLKRPTQEMEEAAASLMAEFDSAYGFLDVAGDLAVSD